MEATPGFEPGNKGFADLCLTTWLCRHTGADNETRTRDPHLGKVMLYQLSYVRIMVPRSGIEPLTQGFSVPCSTY